MSEQKIKKEDVKAVATTVVVVAAIGYVFYNLGYSKAYLDVGVGYVGALEKHIQFLEDAAKTVAS